MRMSVDQLCNDVDTIRETFCNRSKAGDRDAQHMEDLCFQIVEGIRALNDLLNKKELKIEMIANKNRRLENEKANTNSCTGYESCPYRMHRDS